MEITADMAATAWKVLVQPGDEVVADQELVILESMKMEIPVTSPVAGTVHSVSIAEGAPVEEGQVLAVVTER